MALNSYAGAAAGNAISEGIDTFLKAKQMKQQHDLQQQQLGLLSAKDGLIQDPNNPNGFLPSQATQNARDEAQLAYSKTGPQHDSAYALAQQKYKNAFPKPKGMTDEDYSSQMGSIVKPDFNNKELQGLMGNLKTEEGGQFGVAGKALMADAMNSRVSSQQKMQAQTQVNHDPLLASYTQRLDGATKILDLMDGAGKGDIKKNQAFLGQLNAEVAKLETGSSSPALGQAEKTELRDKAAELSSYIDAFNGAPTDSVRQGVIDQIGASVKNLGKSYMGQIDNRMETLKAGSTDDQLPIFEAKHDVYKNKYGKKLGGWSTESNEATPVQPQGQVQQQPQSGGIMNAVKGLLPGGGGAGMLQGSTPQAGAAQPTVQQKPKTVNQNGHVYTLNPATGNYE